MIKDSATNINSDLMKETCERLRTIHQNSTAYGPQMNGGVEASNMDLRREWMMWNGFVVDMND